VAGLLSVAVLRRSGVATAAAASSACPTFESGPAQCNLVITAPETVMTYQTFTVQVAIFSGGEGNAILPSSDPCSPAKVTLDVSRSNGEESFILVASYTANASASIATFNISVADDNFYELRASAPSTATCSYNEDVEFFTAVFIPQTQPIAPCPDNVVCTQVWNGSSTAATLFSDDGAFTGVAFDGATTEETIACGGGPLDSNGVLNFHNTTSSGPKTIIFALASNLVTKGIGQFTVCWDGFLANGTPFTGLLPACGKGATGPCVLFKKSNQKNVGFFGVLAPPGTFDPRGYAK
jgi:hypothetical protein